MLKLLTTAGLMLSVATSAQAQCNVYTPCGGLGQLSRQSDVDLQRQQQLELLRQQNMLIQQQQRPPSQVPFGSRPCPTGYTYC